MSSSVVPELELHPTARETQSETHEGVPHAGCFYRTNAGFPQELDGSEEEYTKSPLRSFHTLPPVKPLDEREPLRVSTDTTIMRKRITKGKNIFNYRRPCYLANYDKSTEVGIIFLGTSKIPNNAHRFVIVQSGPPKDVLLDGALRTKPPYSFTEKVTYLNISHPLRVKLIYGELPCEKKVKDGYDDLYHKQVPPLAYITKMKMHILASVVFDKKSEALFWEKHQTYHKKRPRSNNESGRIEQSDAGPSSGGTGPSSGGAGPFSRGVGPNSRGAGPSSRGDDPSSGGVGLNTSSIGSSVNRCSSYKVEDAPWGQVGDQRIGIDIPLVIEDIYSDSDEEMDLEEPVITSDANDAPWGRVGDQRIGIDIPLVTEDICSESNEEGEEDEEMDLTLDSESFEEDDNVANVSKPESSSTKGITTGPNSSDQASSLSYTIPKPYFVICMLGEGALLDYDHSVGGWKWTKNAFEEASSIVSIEGLSYEKPFFLSMGPREQARRIFNWHTKKYIILPLPPSEFLIPYYPIVGMIVDTSVQPYAFKVIEGHDTGTVIYDSTTHLWTRRISLRPLGSISRLLGNANVASCKGVVFIIADDDQIVLYDLEKDMWGHIRGPTQRKHERLCGIGSWEDRVFLSTSCKVPYSETFEIQELSGWDNPEWKKFDAMPEEMLVWLISGPEVHRNVRFDVSYCNENLLIWVGSNSLAKRFVLYSLDHKTWKKLEPPPLARKDIPMLSPIRDDWELRYLKK